MERASTDGEGVPVCGGRMRCRSRSGVRALYVPPAPSLPSALAKRRRISGGGAPSRRGGDSILATMSQRVPGRRSSNGSRGAGRAGAAGRDVFSHAPLWQGASSQAALHRWPKSGRAEQKLARDGYLILATNAGAGEALRLYRRRWEIETLFAALKSRVLISSPRM